MGGGGTARSPGGGGGGEEGTGKNLGRGVPLVL